MNRGGPIIPTQKNGSLWKESCPAACARNDSLRVTRYYGRAIWKRWAGYHARSRIEAKMRCLKSFGELTMERAPTNRPPKPTSASPSRTASRPSAPPRSSAWHDVSGRRGRHASGRANATTPLAGAECLVQTQARPIQ